MKVTISLVLLIAALVCFAIAAFLGDVRGGRLVPIGLALWVASELL